MYERSQIEKLSALARENVRACVSRCKFNGKSWSATWKHKMKKSEKEKVQWRIEYLNLKSQVWVWERVCQLRELDHTMKSILIFQLWWPEFILFVQHLRFTWVMSFTRWYCSSIIIIIIDREWNEILHCGAECSMSQWMEHMLYASSITIVLSWLHWYRYRVCATGIIQLRNVPNCLILHCAESTN